MTARGGGDDQTYGRAVLYGVCVIGFSAIVFAAVNFWAATRKNCAGAQTHVCDTPAQAAMMIGPSLVLLAGGIGAFVHTYQRYRDGRSWRVWQGAGWFLFILMTAYLMISAGTTVTG